MSYKLLESQAEELAKLEPGMHIIFSRVTHGNVADDIREGTIVGFERPGQKDENVLVKLDGKFPMPLFACMKRDMQLFEEVSLNVVPSMEEAEERYGAFTLLDESKTEETGAPVVEEYYVMQHLPRRVSGPLFKGDDPVGGYAIKVDDQYVPYGKIVLAVWPNRQSFDKWECPKQLFDMEQLVHNAIGRR